MTTFAENLGKSKQRDSKTILDELLATPLANKVTLIQDLLDKSEDIERTLQSYQKLPPDLYEDHLRSDEFVNEVAAESFRNLAATLGNLHVQLEHNETSADIREADRKTLSGAYNIISLIQNREQKAAMKIFDSENPLLQQMAQISLTHSSPEQYFGRQQKLHQKKRARNLQLSDQYQRLKELAVELCNSLHITIENGPASRIL